MSKITINYKVEGEVWEKAVTNAFNKLNAKTKVDGFRLGKTPRHVFESKFGSQNILMEACDFLLDKKYMEILKDEKNPPLIAPKVELVKIEDSVMEANFIVTTAPTVKLKKYKALGVKKPAVKVTKEEIAHEIEHIVEKYAELVTKDGKIEDGNVAIIDFEGFKGGTPFEGGKGENYSLTIGSHTFIPGFEEALIGLSKDSEKDIELTFPEDYMSEELKGQKVVFKVKIHDIKERVLPKMDAEFFKDLDMPEVSSKESLENNVKEHLLAHKETDTENKFIDDLLEAASKNMEIDLDEELVVDEQQRMYDNFIKRMTMQGITEELYFQYTNSNKETIMASMKEEATKRIKYRYLLEEVAKEENIDPSDADAEKEAKILAEKYHTTKEDLLKEFGGLDMIKYDLKMRKAIEVLKENN